MFAIRHIRLLRFLFLAVLLVLYLSSCSSHKNVSSSTATTNSKTALKNKYALLLNIEPKEIKNESLFVFIDDWYAVPYKYAGLDKNGIDCSGFISVLYDKVYNKKIPRSTKELHETCIGVSRSELKEGDLVFFKIDQEKPSHVGLYLMNNKFVHASTKKGIMISDLEEVYFKKYFYTGGRINLKVQS